MILFLKPDPPLLPSPDEGRSLLRHELLNKDYHQLDLIGQLQRWLSRIWDGRIPVGSNVSWGPTIAAMVVLTLLIVGIGLLVSRTRRSPSRRRGRDGGVITDEAISASALRARAEAAYASGDHAAAVVDGFRALARRQVERGRLDDDPGLTAAEVARSLERELPVEGRALGAANLFDAVLYGHHSTTAEQAAGVLALEHELAVTR